MSALDVFIVNVAIPSIRRDLHAAPGQVELTVTAYSMTYAVLLITGGRLGDLFGRTRIYLIGLAVFTLSSAGCGAVGSPILLIVFRVLQAAGAATMIPQAYSVIQRVFSPAERLRAISLLSTAGSMGVVFAQIMGGALIQVNPFGLGWRVVFFVNVPIGVATFVAGCIILPTQRPERTSALDVPGALLASAALLLFVVPIVEGRDLGWPPWLLAALAASPFMTAVFFAQQRRRAAQHRFPLLELSLFKVRSFSAGIPLVATNNFSNAGMYLILTLYLQSGRGLSPGYAGLVFSPNAIAYMVLAPLSPRVARRFGRRTITGGYVCMASAAIVAALVLHFAGVTGSPYLLMVPMGLLGAGQSFINAPLFTAVLSGTPRGHEGSASGFLTMTQQTGNALGAAIAGLIFFSALGSHAASTSRIPPAAASAAYGRVLELNIVLLVTMLVMVRRLPALEGLYRGRTRPGQVADDDPGMIAVPDAPP
jgi:EmrB/QacA subfamily drug resistance transporter